MNHRLPDEIIAICIARVRHCLEMFLIKEWDKKEAYRTARLLILEALEDIEKSLK